MSSYAFNTERSIFDHIAGSLSITDTPAVTDLPSDLITRHHVPYIRRHFLLGNHHGPSARYHHILTSDPQHLHDHPWDFISVILQGSYVERTSDDEQEFGPGSVLVRQAEQLHQLTLPSGPVWTFVIVSAARRRWGFQTADGWVPWRQYLRTD